MNLKETKQLLTMLWSMYPNAPKLTREDKEVMAIAWLSILYMYSLADVWKGVKKCIENEPRFVPTAPEVLQNCEFSYDIERYLSPEYDHELKGVDLGHSEDNRRWRALEYFKNHEPETDEEKQLYEKVKKEDERLSKNSELWGKAYDEAKNAYDEEERQKLIEDGTFKELKRLAIL